MKIKALGLMLLFFSLFLTLGIANVSDPLSLDNLAIPESLGKIESKFKASGRWIIHIQDVHAHLTAQQNIAALIDHLNTAYGIQTVAIEGTWDRSSLPKSWGTPGSREKQMLAQALLEEDYLNGAVYSAIFSKTPVHLVGLEDEALYWENGNFYAQYLKIYETAAQQLGVLEQKILASKENTYNPDLLKFDRALILFRNGKKIKDFIPTVLKTAPEKEIDLAQFPETQKFIKAMEMEKSIDREKLKGEITRLNDTYKYTHLTFEELLQSGKIPEDKLEFYPNAKQYRDLMRAQESISNRIFFLELESIIKLLKKKLLQTSDEMEIDKRSEGFILAKKIITLQATPSEFESFGSRQADITADIEQSGLQDALTNGMSFYEAAKKRDEAFFKKITQDPDLQGSIAVVTGGFHTEGFTRQLEANQISYMVISPDLSEDPVDEALYFKRVRENFASHAFTDLPPDVLSEARDNGFSQATEVLTTDRNIANAVHTYRTFQIGGPSTDAKPLTEKSNFMSLSPEEQTTVAKEYLAAQKSTKRILGIIRQSVLEELLKDPVALTLWRNEILTNRQNTIVIIQDGTSIFTDTEGQANVKMARGEIAEVVKNEERKVVGRESLIGVIDGNYKPEGKVVVLPEHPAALALLRPLLEQDFRIGSEPEALDRLRAILQDIYRVQDALLSAA